MNLAVVLVAAAVLVLVVVLRLSLGSALQNYRRASLSSQIQPIDLDAFRNLTDPAQDDYLRRHLNLADYHRVRRLRLRATAAYVQTIASNAALLVQAGQHALDSADLQTAAAARRLVNDALLVRRNAAFALMRLYVAWAWPHVGFAAAPVLDGYRHLDSSAMLLGRLKNPSAVVRISA